MKCNIKVYKCKNQGGLTLEICWALNSWLKSDVGGTNAEALDDANGLI